MDFITPLAPAKSAEYRADPLYLDLHNIEVSLLIGLMYDRYDWSELPEVRELEPWDFIEPRHRWLFTVIKTLKERGQPPTFPTVRLYFHKAAPDRYNAMRGDRWFPEMRYAHADLAMCVPHLREWAREIKQASSERGEKPAKKKRGISVPTFD